MFTFNCSNNILSINSHYDRCKEFFHHTKRLHFSWQIAYFLCNHGSRRPKGAIIYVSQLCNIFYCEYNLILLKKYYSKVRKRKIKGSSARVSQAWLQEKGQLDWQYIFLVTVFTTNNSVRKNITWLSGFMMLFKACLPIGSQEENNNLWNGFPWQRCFQYLTDIIYLIV